MKSDRISPGRRSSSGVNEPKSKATARFHAHAVTLLAFELSRQAPTGWNPSWPVSCGDDRNPHARIQIARQRQRHSSRHVVTLLGILKRSSLSRPLEARFTSFRRAASLLFSGTSNSTLRSFSFNRRWLPRSPAFIVCCMLIFPAAQASLNADFALIDHRVRRTHCHLQPCRRIPHRERPQERC